MEIGFNPQPKMTKKKQKSELKKWKAKTWKLMSEFIRRQHCTMSGLVRCYTCGEAHHWKEMHCGHYQHGKLDFDHRNLKAQCVSCNTYHGGRLDAYTLRLIDEHGLEWVQQLKADAAKHIGYTLEEIKRIHGDLRNRLNGMDRVGLSG